MEVKFQNKREDFQALYDYMVNETEQGKTMSKQVFRNWLTWAIIYSMFLGSVAWGVSGKLQFGLGVTFFMLLAGGALKLLISGFKPIYHAGVEVFKKQEKSITPRDWQFLQLSRTITIDDSWLEIRSSEAVHQWRWRRVDQIGLTPNFVFIHVGNCPVIYVPKRDFPSEQSFIEFGKKLVELTETHKNQPFGAE